MRRVRAVELVMAPASRSSSHSRVASQERTGLGNAV